MIKSQLQLYHMGLLRRIEIKVYSQGSTGKNFLGMEKLVEALKIIYRFYSTNK